MKVFLVSATLAALATGAGAAPSPYDLKPDGPAVADENALYLGPVGAMLESNYFGVPQPTAGTGRVFPCRIRLHPIGNPPRFAQVCD
jgi:hypothetical protein